MNASLGVSIIICTWNRCDTLAGTLDSVRSLAKAGPVEVLVIDNNSKDATRQVVERAMPGWPLGELRYIFEPRQGKQFALNTAVAAARHEVLAFTDDDILFPADWLQRVAEVFADPGVDLAGGKTLIRWGPSGRPAWYADDMLAILAGVDLGDLRLDPSPSDYAPGGSNLIARRSLFDRVGGYSETHFRHMDHEFGIRCQNRGIRVVYDPTLVVHAPVDERCLTRRYFQRWSFKAGIARDGGIEAVGRRFPAVPRWLYRQIVQDAAWVLARARVEPASEAFSRELRAWRAAGTIANAWHAWALPRSHKQWVERHSQKKNNVY